MKNIVNRIYYILFFCAIAIALFSLENTMQLEEEDLIIERPPRSTTRRSITNEFSQSLPEEENTSSPPEQSFSPSTQEVKETSLQASPITEEKKDEVPIATAPPPSVEKQVDAPKENKKDEVKTNEETEFSSIQSGGLTLANGESWYFEEYDENGNIVSIVSYNKKKLLSKSQFEYNNEGKKISATLTEPKKIIKLAFNDKGEEIGRTEYKKRKGQIGEVYSSYQKNYDTEGRLQEERTIEQGITKRKVYTYNGKKIISETIFENDVKTLFIEYREKVKIVHIFDGEVELSVFEETLE